MNAFSLLQPRVATAILWSALAITSANATVQTYTDPASFSAAVTLAGTDDFFGVAQDAANNSPVSRRTLLGESYHYQAEASTSSLVGAGSASENWLTVNVSTDRLTLSNFSESFTAFGGYFFASDFNGQYTMGNVTLSVTDERGTTLTRTLLNPTVDSFFGIVTDGARIVSVSLFTQPLDNGDSVWPTMRLITFGQASVSAVPEPASALLILSGLGVGYVRSRLRRQKHLC